MFFRCQRFAAVTLAGFSIFEDAGCYARFSLLMFSMLSFDAIEATPPPRHAAFADTPWIADA